MPTPPVGLFSRVVVVANYLFALAAVGVTWYWGQALMTMSAFRGLDFFVLLALVFPAGLLFAVLPGSILWWRRHAPAVRSAVLTSLFAAAILLAEAISLYFVPLRVD